MRFLVVDDLPTWQRRLARALQSLSLEVTIDIADSSQRALQLFQGAAYDLVIMDLALRGKPPAGGASDELGFRLAAQLRNSRDNRHCGLIVVTNYPSLKRFRKAFKRHSAHDFIEKDTFNKRRFLDSVREALRESLLLKSREQVAQRYRLEVRLTEQGFAGAWLTGPRRASFPSPEPLPFKMQDLIEMGDRLNLVVLTTAHGDRRELDLALPTNGHGGWREFADRLGRSIYEALDAARPISSGLHSALSMPPRESDLCLHFRGPASALAVPFELMKDGAGSNFCFRHLLTRESDTNAIVRKTERFDQFLEKLIRSGELLRILVVGANADGWIPGAEEEAAALEQQLEKTLAGLGIRHEVVPLKGAAATYTAVTAALREGRYHLFHYAGHGRFDDRMPEVSGLVLPDPDEDHVRTLRASDLYLLLKDSDLQFVYLSCCLGARTAGRIGSGDFYGVLDALAQADIPTVLSYRWTVLDRSALAMAKHFYRELWRTLSPAEALLAARRAIATGKKGWDDDTWASPVLLAANS